MQSASYATNLLRKPKLIYIFGDCETLDTSMTRQISEPFFNEHPVFRREEYAAAVGRHPRDKTVTGMLSRHLSAGNVKRVGRGVFASVPKHVRCAEVGRGPFLAASRLRQNGVIAYHSALELHGYAYSEGHVVQVISEREPGLVEAASVACRFFRPPKGFARNPGPWSSGVTNRQPIGTGRRSYDH